jgi:hypothetical protein
MAAYILTVSSPLSARWRLVASFPLPSAQAGEDILDTDEKVKY